MNSNKKQQTVLEEAQEFANTNLSIEELRDLSDFCLALAESIENEDK